MFWIHHSDNAIEMTGHFFHLDHANLLVSDHTYIFCNLSFCQIVSEMIDFLGSGVRKWIPWLILRKRLYELPPCGIEIAQYLLQIRNFLFFFSFSNEHLCTLFQILFSNFLQNKIATFFCHLPTDRPTFTRGRAMGNETFYWEGQNNSVLARYSPHEIRGRILAAEI